MKLTVVTEPYFDAAMIGRWWLEADGKIVWELAPARQAVIEVPVGATLQARSHMGGRSDVVRADEGAALIVVSYEPDGRLGSAVSLILCGMIVASTAVVAAFGSWVPPSWMLVPAILAVAAGAVVVAHSLTRRRPPARLHPIAGGGAA